VQGGHAAPSTISGLDSKIETRPEVTGRPSSPSPMEEQVPVRNTHWVEPGTTWYDDSHRFEPFTTEDTHTHAHLGRNDALDLAMACTVRRPENLVWGWVIDVVGTQATAVYGDNQLARFRRPPVIKPKVNKQGKETKKGSEPYTKGRVAPLRKTSTLKPDGTRVTTFSLVKPWGLPRAQDCPQFKATVLTYDEADGSGTAAVMTVGTVSKFTLGLGYSGPEPHPGSTFSFRPILDSDGHLTVPPGYPLELSYASPKAALGLPVATDLFTGYYSPSGRLQAVAKSHFGVDATPFVGKNLSVLKYHAGADLVKRAVDAAGAGPDGKVRTLALASLGDLMLKQELYGRLPRPTGGQVRAALASELHHFLVPDPSHMSAFSTYLRRSMREASACGQRLKVSVGVFIDADATPGSLYNTSDCIFIDKKKFPWVRSLAIVEGHSLCFTFSEELGKPIPAVDSVMGKKLMVVGLDSEFDSMGSLPRVTTVRVTPDEPDLQIPSSESVDVLVGLEAGDPRHDYLVRELGAVPTGSQLTLSLLTVSMSSERAAEELLARTAARPGGMFAIRKRDLHDGGTLTLSCKYPVRSNELYVLLKAKAVFPLSNNRYRFVTERRPLEVAQVLWNMNSYVKRAGKKYQCLRDDSDGFIILDGQAPRTVSKYYRRRGIALTAGDREVTPGMHWHKASNLPRGIPSGQLLTTLSSLSWWPKTRPVLKLDRTDLYPALWIGTTDDLVLPTSFVFGTRRVVVLPSGLPPLGSRDLDRGTEDDILAAGLESLNHSTPWMPNKVASSFLTKHYGVEATVSPQDPPANRNRPRGQIPANGSSQAGVSRAERKYGRASKAGAQGDRGWTTVGARVTRGPGQGDRKHSQRPITNATSTGRPRGAPKPTPSTDRKTDRQNAGRVRTTEPLSDLGSPSLNGVGRAKTLEGATPSMLAGPTDTTAGSRFRALANFDGDFQTASSLSSDVGSATSTTTLPSSSLSSGGVRGRNGRGRRIRGGRGRGRGGGGGRGDGGGTGSGGVRGRGGGGEWDGGEVDGDGGGEGSGSGSLTNDVKVAFRTPLSRRDPGPHGARRAQVGDGRRHSVRQSSKRVHSSGSDNEPLTPALKKPATKVVRPSPTRSMSSRMASNAAKFGRNVITNYMVGRMRV
jgi:hypothetical protein